MPRSCGQGRNEVYNAVRDTVQGASCGCAAVFGSTEGVQSVGLPLVTDNAISGTPGLLSLRRYAREGWNALVF